MFEGCNASRTCRTHNCRIGQPGDIRPPIKSMPMKAVLAKRPRSVLPIWSTAILMLAGCAGQPANQEPSSNNAVTAESHLLEVNLFPELAGSGGDNWLKIRLSPPPFQESADILSGCTPGRSLTANYPDGTSVFDDTHFDSAMQHRLKTAEQRHILNFRETQFNKQHDFIYRQLEAYPALKDRAKFEQVRREHRSYLAWQKRMEEAREAVRQREEGRRSGFKGGFSEAMRISLLAGTFRSVEQSRPRFHYRPEIHSIPDNLDAVRRNGKVIEARNSILSAQEMETGKLLLEVRIRAERRFQERIENPGALLDLIAFSAALDSRLAPCLAQAKLTAPDRDRLGAVDAAHDQLARALIERNRSVLLALPAQARTANDVDHPLKQLISSDRLRRMVLADPSVAGAFMRRKNELSAQEEQVRTTRERERLAAIEKDRQERIQELRRKASENVAPTMDEVRDLLVKISVERELQRGEDAEHSYRGAYVTYKKNPVLDLFGLNRLVKVNHEFRLSGFSCHPDRNVQACSWSVSWRHTHEALEMRGDDYLDEGFDDKAEFFWTESGLQTKHVGYYTTTKESASVPSWSSSAAEAADADLKKSRARREMNDSIEANRRRIEAERIERERRAAEAAQWQRQQQMNARRSR